MPPIQDETISGKIPRSVAPIPGLPSRGPERSAARNLELSGSPPATPDIVALADATLAAERPAGKLGGKQGERIEPPSTKAEAEPASDEATSPPADDDRAPESAPSLASDRAAAMRRAAPETSEPAPVLSSAERVIPGKTAEVIVGLVNEDRQPHSIELFGTALIGPHGASIPSESLSFHPRELTLAAGGSGAITVEIPIPADTRDGVYSGLIRASRLDYLRAVLAVQVERAVSPTPDGVTGPQPTGSRSADTPD